MLTALMGDMVEITRYGEVSRDRLNNPVLDVVSRFEARARLVQDSSAERDNADVVIDRWRASFAPDTDVRAGDTVRRGGVEFTVEGTPARKAIPGLPGADHVAAVLRHVGQVR